MVPVVEAGELGRDDPDRRGEDEQQRGGRPAPPEPHKDRSEGDRKDVAEREHPPQERFRVVARRNAIGYDDIVGTTFRSSGGDLELTQSAASSWTARTGCTQRGYGSFARREPLLIRHSA